MQEIIQILENLGSKLLFPFLTGYIFFKSVEFFTKKININEYTYNEYSNEDNNLLNVKWFNAQFKKNNKKDYTYRFKINNKYVIFIKRHDLQLHDRLKLSFWLIKEYICNIISKKINSKRDKILPKWLITTYIEPEYTQFDYNLQKYIEIDNYKSVIKLFNYSITKINQTNIFDEQYRIYENSINIFNILYNSFKKLKINDKIKFNNKEKIINELKIYLENAEKYLKDYE